jgi:hypothetical protein
LSQFTKIVGVATISLFINGCSFVSETQRIELQSDAVVQIDNNRPQPYKSGDVVEIDGDAALVEQPGHVSLLILPATEAGANYKINLRPYQDWSGEFLASKTNSQIGKILSEVSSIQVQLSKGQTKLALENIRILQQKNPGVTYLKFYEATCHYLLSNTSEAIAALKIALKDFPNDAQGKELLTTLESNRNIQKTGN